MRSESIRRTPAVTACTLIVAPEILRMPFPTRTESDAVLPRNCLRTVVRPRHRPAAAVIRMSTSLRRSPARWRRGMDGSRSRSRFDCQSQAAKLTRTPKDVLSRRARVYPRALAESRCDASSWARAEPSAKGSVGSRTTTAKGKDGTKRGSADLELITDPQSKPPISHTSDVRSR